MFHFLLEFTEIRVALLAEGVDRNPMEIKSFTKSPRSPSSRRAWIEMSQASNKSHHPKVALLAEGVDRNKTFQFSGVKDVSRPPRGGRG